MAHTIKYSFISLFIVTGILLQLFQPLAGHNLGPDEIDDSSATPAAATRITGITAQCYVNYLPLVINEGASLAGSINLRPASAALAGPDVAIISPRDGWTISGMLWFAVQSSDLISSVTFRAGSTVLGTDTTPDDGFKIFLDAAQLPAGPQEISATAVNPCGQTTKSINVTVVANPPSSDIIGAQGGVLASEIGSIVTFPPGTVPDGTGVGVSEKTQGEITTLNGFDWDAMGVTFLGAQMITATVPISSPLMVASAGFGPRVQPGQIVVNYNILPDADGDGVDELVVANTASVAPNDDVISDPVPQVMLASGQIQASYGTFREVQNVISGPPGTFFNMEVTGLNLFSARGNRAIYHSSVDGTEVTLPVAIVDIFKTRQTQRILGIIPSLPPGPATLRLHNASTGSDLGPFPMIVETPAPLTRPAAEIIDEFLVSTSDQFTALTTVLVNEAAFSQSVAFIESAKIKINELRPLIQTMNADPELTGVLSDMAVIIENSAVPARAPGLQASQLSPSGSLCDNKEQVLKTIDPYQSLKLEGLGFASSLALALGNVALKAANSAFFALSAFSSMADVTAMSLIIIDCARDRPLPPQSIYSSPLFFEGMGSVPPSGGSGAGNAPVSPAANSLGLAPSQLRDGPLPQAPGRIIVKVAPAGGSGFPFSGATDAGGYFYIPLIPEGVPFVATAIDTLTGQMRTAEGIGPSIGTSVFLSFDFFSGGNGGTNELQFGDVISASLDAPAEVDVYTFQGNSGDQVLFRMKGLSGNHYPAFEVHRPDGSLLCSNPSFGVNFREEVCALDATGSYTVLYSDYLSSNTGQYQLYLQRLNAPGVAQGISFGQTMTGTVNFLLEMKTFTFDSQIGDQLLVRASEADYSQTLNPVFKVYRPDGTLLCEMNSPSSGQVEKTCMADASGTHTVLVGDWVAQFAAPLALYVQRLNNPGQVTPISFGEIQSGTLSIAASAGTYRFDGASGDQVIVRMLRTAQLPAGVAFWPKYRIYRDDGSELCSVYNGTLAETTCVLDATGSYSILTSNQQGLGSYDLFLQRSNSPAGATSITYGETITDSINLAVALDAYSFNGLVGEQVHLQMTRLSGNLNPHFRVYRPDGTLLCEMQTTASVSDTVCLLDAAGTHAILVGEYGGLPHTGGYNLLIELAGP